MRVRSESVSVNAVDAVSFLARPGDGGTTAAVAVAAAAAAVLEEVALIVPGRLGAPPVLLAGGMPVGINGGGGAPVIRNALDRPGALTQQK